MLVSFIPGLDGTARAVYTVLGEAILSAGPARGLNGYSRRFVVRLDHTMGVALRYCLHLRPQLRENACEIRASLRFRGAVGRDERTILDLLDGPVLCAGGNSVELVYLQVTAIVDLTKSEMGFIQPWTA